MVRNLQSINQVISKNRINNIPNITPSSLNKKNFLFTLTNTNKYKKEGNKYTNEKRAWK